MSRLDRNVLLRMLWDMNPSQDSITTVSRYMGSFPQNVDEIVAIWEEQLSECFGDRKILFLYVLNDVIQVFRGSLLSTRFLERLNIFLYSVIRDVPSLLSKVQHLVSVWVERRVISDYQGREAERTIQAALDDYHHNSDRRDHRNSLPNDSESFSDLGSFDPSYDEPVPEVNSVDSAEDIIPQDEEDPVEEEWGDEQRLQLIDSVIQAGIAVEEELKAVGKCERNIDSLPEWVTSIPSFQSQLSLLEDNTEQTSDILYRAMEPVMNLESHVNSVIEKRTSLRSILESVHDWKKKRTEVLLKTIEECKATTDLLYELGGDEEEIRRTLRRHRSVVTPLMMRTSSKAMESITNTLKQAEEEEKRKRTLEEEQKQKEQALKDSISKEIIRTSAEEMIGKTWNARGLFDRILCRVSCESPFLLEGIVTLTKDSIASVESVCIQDEYRDKLEGIILSNGLLEDRSEKLAYDLSQDYAGEPVHLLCVLKGAHVFFTALTQAMRQFGMVFSYDFVKVKSYCGTESTGNVRVDGIDLDTLKGRNVIVVEDIIDTGRTMQALVPLIQSHGAKSCVTCVLCEKDTPLSCGFKSNYCGFIIPDFFIVGNGFDFDEVMREMPHSGCISPYGIDYYTKHKLFCIVCS